MLLSMTTGMVSRSRERMDDMEDLTLQIDGMSCGHCVARVKKALSNLDGVEVRNVEVGSAEMSYDPSRVSPGQVLEAVDAAGYEPRVAGASV
jgi:copper chaperone CopZ